MNTEKWTASRVLVIKYGRDDSALKDVTLIVTADNKVGLYDNQGKEMK